MNFLIWIYPYRRYIGAVLLILSAFCFGYYRGRVTAPVRTVEKPVEKVVTDTVTQTEIRYVPKAAPTDPDVDVKIPKQEITVAVNGKRQVIKKSDSEKYIFDENQLKLEQSSKASLDITVPVIDKTRRWSIGIGAGKDGTAYMLRGPVSGHLGAWAAGSKEMVMAGISFDF